MQHQVDFGPAYSLLSLQLGPGEEIRCESGAMVSMSGNLEMAAKMNAGRDGGNMFGRALGALAKSALGGESFFITAISAPNGPGEVTLAPSTPGDIAHLPLQGHGVIVQRGSYLASEPAVEVDTKWGGLKGVMGGEGLFFLRCSGRGELFLSSFGGIFSRDLGPGETYVVDSGHLVAYQEGMTMEAKVGVGSKGFLSRAVTSATSGEGLVMNFTGPGRVWMQTRHPTGFANWLTPMLPFSRSGN